MLCRVPRTVAAHVALLVPHLGCDAYPIRSGIVTAIGHLLAGAFEQGARDGADSQGTAPMFALERKCHSRTAMVLASCKTRKLLVACTSGEASAHLV